jgi:hypothetical protein
MESLGRVVAVWLVLAAPWAKYPSRIHLEDSSSPRRISRPCRIAATPTGRKCVQSSNFGTMLNKPVNSQINSAGCTPVEPKSMKKLVCLVLIVWGSAVNAQNAPATANQAQGEARQLGMLVGGTATEYDLCVKKGAIAKGEQSAEETAKAFFEKMRTNGGPDQSGYVQEGWDVMRKEISAHESFYTQEKCIGVGKEWAKITATMHKK